MIATSAAGVWLGGMILIAIVAQTTFAVMRETGVDQPNALAGQIMAKNFLRFDMVQLGCAGILVLWNVIHIISGGRSLLDWLRLVVILLATALLLYSVSVLTPKITNLQSAVASADPDTAIKAIFDDFHETAVRISKANLILVAMVLFSLAWLPKGKPTTDDNGPTLKLQDGGAAWPPHDQPPKRKRRLG